MALLDLESGEGEVLFGRLDLGLGQHPREVVAGDPEGGHDAVLTLRHPPHVEAGDLLDSVDVGVLALELLSVDVW